MKHREEGGKIGRTGKWRRNKIESQKKNKFSKIWSKLEKKKI